MTKLEDAIERIKILECPTGQVENRVAQILEQYNVVHKGEVKVSRDDRFSKDGTEAYVARLSEDEGIVVLAEAGLDDYVAKVVDVYTNME